MTGIGVGASIGRKVIDAFPPIRSKVVQWLGNTFNLNNLWYQEDKIGNRYDAQLINNNCVEGNGGDINVLLDTIALNDAIEWTISFTKSLHVYTSTFGFVVGGQSTKNLGLTVVSTENPFYRGEDTVYHAWDGTGNTVLVEGTLPGAYIFSSDGTNIHLTIDGISKGYITPTNTKLYVSRYINGYSGTALGYSGKLFSMAVWDTYNADITDVDNSIFYHTMAEGIGIHYDKSPNGNDGTPQGTLTNYYTTDNEQRPNNLLNGFTQGLVSTSAGTSYKESTQIYGIWEFDIYRDTISNDYTLYFMSDANTIGSDTGYFLEFNAIGSLVFGKRDSGITTEFWTKTLNFSAKTNYRYKIERTADGGFSFEQKGGAIGLEYQPIAGTDIIDNTVVVSNYIVISAIELGAEISNMKLADLQNTDIGLVSGDSTITNVGNILDNTYGYISTSIAFSGDSINAQLARWSALPDKSKYNWVIVQIGLNDLQPAEAASVALARYQNYIDTIRVDVPVDCKIIVSSMILVHQRLVDLYGAIDGEIAYQKELDMNDAIMGIGTTPITNVDARNDYHVPILSDENGDLKSEYDTGDHIHPNYNGRVVIADGWEISLDNISILPPVVDLMPFYLFDFTNGTGVYERIYYPVDPTRTGEDLSNPGTLFGHNNAETQYLQPETFDLIQVANNFAVNPWFDGSGNAIACSYETILNDYEAFHQWFADIYSKDPVKFNWLVYNEVLTGDDLDRVLDFVKSE